MTATQRLFTAELRALKAKGVEPEKSDQASGQILARAVAAPVAASSGPDRSQEIIDNLDDLKSKIEEVLRFDFQEVERLRSEFGSISERIEETKREIAQLRNPAVEEDEEDDKLRTASSALGAVVTATENATSDILGAAERLDEIVQGITSRFTDDDTRGMMEEASEQVVKIYEACNFQDLTGQRITRVVDTLDFIDERIGKMVAIWGPKEFDGLPTTRSVARKDGDLELAGPTADPVETIDQAAIDALFD